MTEVLRVTALEQRFEGTTVLQGVTFSLDPGERLAVLGPSGSGKTTLLRIIAGLEPPVSGEVVLSGQTASKAGEVVIPPERRGVALVFQGLALFPHLRALEQITFAARGRGGMRRSVELLERVGLGHRPTARLDELSGGERQRIALARALAQEPKLILMDEPFASLDDEKRAEMRDLLRSLLERTETTLVLVTHSRDDALDLARRAIVLDRGKPVAQDFLEAVLTRPGHAATVRTLGLGQVIDAQVSGPAEATTAFGKVQAAVGTRSGRVRLLIRPDQPCILENGAEGTEADVIGLELRPPDSREVRRVALVRANEVLLRVRVRGAAPSIGERVRIRIDGETEIVEG